MIERTHYCTVMIASVRFRLRRNHELGCCIQFQLSSYPAITAYIMVMLHAYLCFAGGPPRAEAAAAAGVGVPVVALPSGHGGDRHGEPMWCNGSQLTCTFTHPIIVTLLPPFWTQAAYVRGGPY